MKGNFLMNTFEIISMPFNHTSIDSLQSKPYYDFPVVYFSNNHKMVYFGESVAVRNRMKK